MKKLIKQFLIEKLEANYNGKNLKLFFFLRWIVELIKDQQKTKDILGGIALYMFNASQKLPFEDIFVIDNDVFIYTTRPGLWIGKRGETIDSIIKIIDQKKDGTVKYGLKPHFIENTKGAVAEVNNIIKVFNDVCY